MDRQKNDENIILKLKKHLGKMMVQVDFLYRNGRPLEQFDYDILMDRIREFYELLIDSQVLYPNPNHDPNPNPDPNFDDEENQNDEALNNDIEFEIEIPGETEKNEEENSVEEDDDIDDEDWEDEEDVTFHVEDEEERLAISDERLAISDERLERKEERGEQNLVNPVEKSTNPVEKSTNPVDDSLAARLQRQPISDIKSVVTLNDRIMMINDLFKGSSERYNKTINVLNEFPTVGGAIVYLSELRVELQWDVESEAYMKLQELVQRRFL